MPAGQPTKYKPEYCDTVIQLAEDGLSFTELAVELGVARATLYNWREENPEFLDALEKAREKSMSWYSKTFRGQHLPKDKDGNTMPPANIAGVIFQAKNQFPDDYKDRRDINHEGELKLVEVVFTGYDEDEHDEDEHSD